MPVKARTLVADGLLTFFLQEIKKYTNLQNQGSKHSWSAKNYLHISTKYNDHTILFWMEALF